jgi:hypothetical protein
VRLPNSASASSKNRIQFFWPGAIEQIVDVLLGVAEIFQRDL